ncbi:TetR/AcrR family transcriptional regulator [Pseudomonas sp. N040]|uniref:TetR/AcrR family transcriptional regulator n=1 Tax=Pseudomonas sp. N040 TaxID=2785325 RepID=UPI0018A29340|nr:TetR/AcrR family transcriptional regulator [Pseudomonas sp. N040]MBF7729270.1 TetR/AcrR family transcriptional regulator [Pseudomonas sp. N040]MBW7012910.1 TetR/AcrR family transcriptional regulator [Pseudomonas sp. N040]
MPPVVHPGTPPAKPAATARARRRPGRPRADEPQGEGLREVVIAAAARVYASHGYRGGSVDLIAREAGISRPLFYRLFKDRHEVIEVVVQRANDDLRVAVLQAILPQARLLPMLSAAIDAYFDWCRSHAPIVGSIYREVHDPESPASFHQKKIIEEMAQLVRVKAEERGSQPLHPLMLETLIGAIEHVGSVSFWPQPKPPAELARNRAVIERIVLAAVAGAADQADVPGIDTVLA